MILTVVNNKKFQRSLDHFYDILFFTIDIWWGDFNMCVERTSFWHQVKAFICPKFRYSRWYIISPLQIATKRDTDTGSISKNTFFIKHLWWLLLSIKQYQFTLLICTEKSPCCLLSYNVNNFWHVLLWENLQKIQFLVWHSFLMTPKNKLIQCQ